MFLLKSSARQVLRVLKYKEYDNYETLDALADIIEPTSVILMNEKVKESFAKEKNKLMIAKTLLKECPKEIIEILARLDGKSVDEYKCTLVSVPVAVLEILNDEAMTDFFKSQGQSLAEGLSGSATENIEETEETSKAS